MKNKKKNTMVIHNPKKHIQMMVSIAVEPINDQPFGEFLSEDGQVMATYLREKIEEAIEDAWQYNARVSKYKIQFIH